MTTKKKTRETDVTLQMPVLKPKYVFVAIKYGEIYEQEIHSGHISPGDSLEKIMSHGVSQYCADTETLKLPYHETWQLVKDGKVVLSFSRADLEDKDRFWKFFQMIKTHTCLTVEIRNDY